MSELAVRSRIAKRSWAAPGSFHDRLIRLLKILLPMLIGILAAYLAIAPLQKGKEISFLLDKNKVDVAQERMRIREARYRGQDDQGRPFTISADSAVQETSREQIVDVRDMTASITLEDGPATLQANRGHYHLERELVDVIGPLLFTAAEGYRILTRDVIVNLNSRTLVSRGRVEGRTPLGTFWGDRLIAHLPTKRVLLNGDVQGRVELGAFTANRALADLPAQRVLLTGDVRGRMELGTFTAGRALADMPARTFVLTGRPRLHIRQGALR